MLKELFHWVVIVALALQLFSCVFMGQSMMPGVGLKESPLLLCEDVGHLGSF